MMFIKIVAVLIVLSTSYVIGVFVFPETFDKYGHVALNTRIRGLKMSADSLPQNSPGSLVDSLKLSFSGLTESASGYISSGTLILEEGRLKFDESRKKLELKYGEYEEFSKSVKKIFESVEEANDNMKDLRTWSGNAPP